MQNCFQQKPILFGLSCFWFHWLTASPIGISSGIGAHLWSIDLPSQKYWIQEPFGGTCCLNFLSIRILRLHLLDERCTAKCLVDSIWHTYIFIYSKELNNSFYIKPNLWNLSPFDLWKRYACSADIDGIFNIQTKIFSCCLICANLQLGSLSLFQGFHDKWGNGIYVPTNLQHHSFQCFIPRWKCSVPLSNVLADIARNAAIFFLFQDDNHPISS